MNPSEAIVVFMSIAESADRGSGPTIIEVFYDEDGPYAEMLVAQIKEEVLKKWLKNKTSEKDRERIKKTAENVAEIITLDEAIKRIKEDIHDGYSSMSDDY
jgi:hypothetical protein